MRNVLKISVFFDKTYLQKPYCVTIENISSNKTKLQLSFVLKNKDLKSLKLILINQLKLILDNIFRILQPI